MNDNNILKKKKKKNNFYSYSLLKYFHFTKNEMLDIINSLCFILNTNELLISKVKGGKLKNVDYYEIQKGITTKKLCNNLGIKTDDKIDEFENKIKEYKFKTLQEAEIFIQGLTSEEVGFRNPNNVTTDGDVNDEGLILDYFKETFLVNEDNIETRRIPLRALPLDPIRHLYYNGEELKQDRDYSIDFNKKEIIFPIINTDKESSRLNLNDKIEIIYTPNIDDDSLILAWYAKRTNLLKQVKIEPYYIEYKA